MFDRLEPFAGKHGVRLVLVNRRDFPGAEPYAADERSLLIEAQGSLEALTMLHSYMCERARELYDFLALFVKQEGIRPVDGSQGGVSLVTWSFGSTWLLALLANITKFTTTGENNRKYIRRTILYGELGVD